MRPKKDNRIPLQISQVKEIPQLALADKLKY